MRPPYSLYLNRYVFEYKELMPLAYGLLNEETLFVCSLAVSLGYLFVYGKKCTENNCTPIPMSDLIIM